ncbi:MAG TPA: hypothetical protein VH302_11125 [Bryobacteraceae bacterium]|jgi:hypothetical protein|nr:hypothetical protein [Bryobacteraceae bacterium]
MKDSDNKRVWTDFAGRTYVDGNALLRDPKVRETMARLSEMNKSMRGRAGVRFLKPQKVGD